MARARLLATVALLALPGCSLLQRAPEAPSPGAGTPAPPRDLASIPDAVPRDEPRSRYGNPETYEVFGRRYRVMKSAKGHVERGLASWYGPGFHAERTSSGEPYDMYAMTAAHKTLPIPAFVRVTNLENGRSVVVRVNDRGPFVGDRIIDLSYTAAWKLDMLRAGTAKVEIRVLEPGRTPPPPPVLAQAAVPTPTPVPTPAPVPVATPAALASPVIAAAPAASRMLQVGAFGLRSNAEAMASRLQSAGIADAVVSEAAVAGRTVYRVRVGPVADAAQAADLAERLRAIGIPDARPALD
ncbi:MAG: septal ring lytic transglycosylase RlpA family protein [Gammaproteobacteria bacterium]|nr:septal ring lytic transglycosylase RlpA family protein [Gammaproteobacteria bacterium]